MAISKIKWTKHSINPATGCTKISPGCKNCYAEKFARRLTGMHKPGYADGFNKITLLPERLEQLKKRKKSTLYFMGSMTDLFHKDVPDTFLDSMFEIIRQTPQHTYQILTKRAERLPDYFSDRKCPPNVWLGVSVEDRKYGLPRIDYLRQVDAKVRFLSIEPLLENLGPIELDGIHWVIVGGEAGSKARPMKPSWVTNVKKQTDAAGIAFFFKQRGTFEPDGVTRTNKAKDNIYLGRTWEEYPNVD